LSAVDRLRDRDRYIRARKDVEPHAQLRMVWRVRERGRREVKRMTGRLASQPTQPGWPVVAVDPGAAHGIGQTLRSCRAGELNDVGAFKRGEYESHLERLACAETIHR
jgi:hypothetical protein